MDLSRQMEDYLEVIGDLCRGQGVARVKDISRRLGVSSPSVVGALRTLKKHQLVDQEPYGFVRLTQAGEARASALLQRHQLLADFLENILGVDAETASQDACRIEHVVSGETVSRLRAMAEFLRSAVHADLDWSTEFRKFYNMLNPDSLEASPLESPAKPCPAEPSPLLVEVAGSVEGLSAC